MALHLSPRVRRIAVAIAALVVFVALVGATYQGVATALERREFQRPGGLVDAGGFQLHIYCTGEGSPTVLLEAAAGSMSQAWGWVQPEVARVTRVCSYDRAGLGRSESRDAEYTPSRVPEELRTLLDQANEHGPFVVVGHELGAAFARLFAARYPASTAALVLVEARPGGRDIETPRVTAWPWLARVGLLRATASLSARATTLPGSAGGAMRAFLNRPDHLTRAAQEIAGRRTVEGQAMAARVPPVPIVSVEVGGQSPPAMLAARDEAMRVSQAIEAVVERLREDLSSSREP
jgi:pimeloyl-ACP methyl ester carboxylesterase